MKVTLEDCDGEKVSLTDVRYIKLDRGSKGEVIISNRQGVLSMYQNGEVLYTEEKKKKVMRDRRGRLVDRRGRLVRDSEEA